MATKRVCDAKDPPRSSADTAPALLRELIEALTALGNYLALADNLTAESTDSLPERLGDAIEKSIAQYERAARSARRLRDLYGRRSIGDALGFR